MSDSWDEAVYAFTGMRVPDAKPPPMWALADKLEDASRTVINQLSPELAQIVRGVQATVHDGGGRKFVSQTSKFVIDEPKLLPVAGGLLETAAQSLRQQALQIDYTTKLGRVMFVFMQIQLAIAAIEAAFGMGPEAVERIATTRSIIRSVLSAATAKTAAHILGMQMLFMPGSSLIAQLWQIIEGRRKGGLDGGEIGHMSLYALAGAGATFGGLPFMKGLSNKFDDLLKKAGVADGIDNPLAGIINASGISVALETGAGILAAGLVDGTWNLAHAADDALSGFVEGSTEYAAGKAGKGARGLAKGGRADVPDVDLPDVDGAAAAPPPGAGPGTDTSPGPGPGAPGGGKPVPVPVVTPAPTSQGGPVPGLGTGAGPVVPGDPSSGPDLVGDLDPVVVAGAEASTGTGSPSDIERRHESGPSLETGRLGGGPGALPRPGSLPGIDLPGGDLPGADLPGDTGSVLGADRDGDDVRGDASTDVSEVEQWSDWDGDDASSVTTAPEVGGDEALGDGDPDPFPLGKPAPPVPEAQGSAGAVPLLAPPTDTGTDAGPGRAAMGPAAPAPSGPALSGPAPSGPGSQPGLAPPGAGPQPAPDLTEGAARPALPPTGPLATPPTLVPALSGAGPASPSVPPPHATPAAPPAPPAPAGPGSAAPAAPPSPPPSNATSSAAPAPSSFLTPPLADDVAEEPGAPVPGGWAAQTRPDIGAWLESVVAATDGPAGMEGPDPLTPPEQQPVPPAPPPPAAAPPPPAAAPQPLPAAPSSPSDPSAAQPLPPTRPQDADAPSGVVPPEAGPSEPADGTPPPGPLTTDEAFVVGTVRLELGRRPGGPRFGDDEILAAYEGLRAAPGNRLRTVRDLAVDIAAVLRGEPLPRLRGGAPAPPTAPAGGGGAASSAAGGPSSGAAPGPSGTRPGAPDAGRRPGAEGLDDAFGTVLGPKEVKAGERDDQGELRLNPLWTPLEDLSGAVLDASPEGALWQYSVDEQGRVFLGTEEPSSVMSQAQIDDLFAGMSAKDPGLTREALMESLTMLGHPTIVASFDPVTGATRVVPARISGELTRVNGVWTINDKSGRYMSKKVRGEPAGEDLVRWIGNVADAMSAQFGMPVATQILKHAAPAPPVASAVPAVAPADAGPPPGIPAEPDPGPVLDAPAGGPSVSDAGPGPDPVLDPDVITELGADAPVLDGGVPGDDAAVDEVPRRADEAEVLRLVRADLTARPAAAVSDATILSAYRDLRASSVHGSRLVHDLAGRIAADLRGEPAGRLLGGATARSPAPSPQPPSQRPSSGLPLSELSVDEAFVVATVRLELARRPGGARFGDTEILAAYQGLRAAPGNSRRTVRGLAVDVAAVLRGEPLPRVRGGGNTSSSQPDGADGPAEEFELMPLAGPSGGGPAFGPPPTGPQVTDAPTLAAPAPVDLDQEFGEVLGPKEVKAGERDDQGGLRLNPLWTPLEGFSGKHLEGAPEGALWQYAVAEDGQIFLGSEDVLSVVPESEIDELFGWLSSKDPTLTRAELVDRLQMHGHPTIVAGFDPVTGATVTVPARISGELSRVDGVWTINDKSGRYMSKKVRGEPAGEDLVRWIGNVADAMSARFGVPVATQILKHAAPPAPPPVVPEQPPAPEQPPMVEQTRPRPPADRQAPAPPPPPLPELEPFGDPPPYPGPLTGATAGPSATAGPVPWPAGAVGPDTGNQADVITELPADAPVLDGGLAAADPPRDWAETEALRMVRADLARRPAAQEVADAEILRRYRDLRASPLHRSGLVRDLAGRIAADLRGDPVGRLRGGGNLQSRPEAEPAATPPGLELGPVPDLPSRPAPLRPTAPAPVAPRPAAPVVAEVQAVEAHGELTLPHGGAPLGLVPTGTPSTRTPSSSALPSNTLPSNMGPPNTTPTGAAPLDPAPLDPAPLDPASPQAPVLAPAPASRPQPNLEEQSDAEPDPGPAPLEPPPWEPPSFTASLFAAPLPVGLPSPVDSAAVNDVATAPTTPTTPVTPTVPTAPVGMAAPPSPGRPTLTEQTVPEPPPDVLPTVLSSVPPSPPLAEAAASTEQPPPLAPAPPVPPTMPPRGTVPDTKPDAKPEPEPEPKPAAPEPSNAPPERLSRHGRLSASDPVIHLDPDRSALFTWLRDNLQTRLGDTWPGVEADLLDFLNTDTLKPWLTGMTRGDRRSRTIRRGGWTITVTLDAKVRDFHRTGTPKAFEAEVGTESFGTGGGQHEKGATSTAGTQGKAEVGGFRWFGSLAGTWRRARGTDATGRGRVAAKAKIVEPTALYDGITDLGVSLTLKQHGRRRPAPARREFPIGTQIGVPVADSPDADGKPVPPTAHYVPPQRIQDDHRFGSTDVVLDVFPLVPDGMAAMRDTRGMEGVLDGQDAVGREVYGDSWPLVKKELLTEVDLDWVQHRMRGMMSGSPISVKLVSTKGRVEVTAEVTGLDHQRATARTEFNSGTETSFSASQTATAGDELSASPGQLVGRFAGYGEVSVPTLLGAAREGGVTREIVTTSGMANKTKNDDGQKFDGTVRLTFRFVGADITRTGTADLGTSALIETAEAVRVDEPTPWQASAPATVPVPAGETSTAGDATATQPGDSIPAPPTDSVPKDSAPAPVPPRDVLVPPQRLFGTGPNNGLRDTDTVRDLYRLEEAHRQLDIAGRRFFGKRTWAGLRDEVLEWYSMERLAANLGPMTRGAPLGGPEFNQRFLPRGSYVEAGAQVRSARFRRTADTELAPVNQVRTQNIRRRQNFWLTEITGMMGGAAPFPGGDVAPQLGGGAQYRSRRGWRALLSGKTVASAKFPSQVGIYDSEVELTFTFGARGRRFPFSLVPKRTVTRQAAAAAEISIPSGEGYLFPSSTTALPEITSGGHQRLLDTLQAEQLTGGDSPRTVQPTGRLARPAPAPAAPAAPETPAPETPETPAAPATPAPETPSPGAVPAAPGEQRQTRPPERADRGRIGVNDIVLSMGSDEQAVMRRVENDLRRWLPRSWTANERRLSPRLGGAGLRSRLPTLSGGESVSVPVGGRLVRGKAVMRAGVGPLEFQEVLKDVEMESGTESGHLTGQEPASRVRRIGQFMARVRAPWATISAVGTHNRDRTNAQTNLHGGGMIARGKTVDDGALFNGTVDVTVDYKLRLFGVIPLRLAPAQVSLPDVKIIFPAWETRARQPDGRAERQSPQPALLPPRRIQEERRLGSSDLVQDLYTPERTRGGRPEGVDGLLADLDAAGRATFGRRRWKGVPGIRTGGRDAVRTELSMTRLLHEFPGMSAGGKIEIAVPGGRVFLTVASVGDQTQEHGGLRHVGNTSATEFNNGTDQLSVQAGAFGKVPYETSQSTQVQVRGLVTIDPTGVAPVHGRVGPAVVAQWGTDQSTTPATVLRSGVTTKNKVPGAVFDGPALLRFELHRDHHLPRMVRRSGRFGLRWNHGSWWSSTGASQTGARVRLLVERSEAEPATAPTVPDGPKAPSEPPGPHRPPAPPNPVRQDTTSSVLSLPSLSGSPAPPSRVWAENGGLLDTDVVRRIPDTSGLQSALDIAGTRLFGADDWGKVRAPVLSSFGNAGLESALPSMTRGAHGPVTDLLNHLFAGAASVTANAEVLYLSHQGTAKKAELNTSNEAGRQSTRREHVWGAWGLQVWGGIAVDHGIKETGTFDVYAGGGATWKNTDSYGSGGRVVDSAKFSRPTANFAGFAKIDITLTRGSRTETITVTVPVELGFPRDELTASYDPTLVQATVQTGADGSEVQWFGPTGMVLPGDPAPVRTPPVAWGSPPGESPVSQSPVSQSPVSQSPVLPPLAGPPLAQDPASSLSSPSLPPPLLPLQAEAQPPGPPLPVPSGPAVTAAAQRPPINVLTVDGGTRTVHEVRGDGECFFTSVLAGAATQHPGAPLGALTVGDLRAHTLAWFTGSAGTSMRRSLDLHLDQDLRDRTVQAILPGLTTSDLRYVLTGSTANGNTSAARLRQEITGLLGRPAEHANPAWGRLLEVRQVMTNVPDLARLLRMPPSAAATEALRRRDLWNTPFFDHVPDIVAAAAAVNVVVVTSRPNRSLEVTSLHPGSAQEPRPSVYVHYNGVNHYQAMN